MSLEKAEDTETEEKPHEDQNGRWNYAATSQAIPGANRSQKRQGELPPLEPLEGMWSVDTLRLDFWPLELWENEFLLF